MTRQRLLLAAVLGVVGTLSGLVALRAGLPSGGNITLASSVVGASVPREVQDDIRTARTVGTEAGPSCPGTEGSTRVFWTATADPDGAPVIAAYHVEPGSEDAPDSLIRATCRPLQAHLDQAVDAVQTTVGLSDEETLPAAGLITVGDEVMAVDPATAGTATLKVVRWGGARPHDAGEPVAALWTLAAPLAADDPDPVLHLTDASGLPADGPYRLLVGGEVVTVDGGYGTRDLGLGERPLPLDHPASDRVRAQAHDVGRPLARWPSSPRLDVAVGTDDAEPTLVLSGGGGLPAVTPYQIFVDDEPMTVTGRVRAEGGTTWLSVRRTSQAEHTPGAPVRLGSALADPLTPTENVVDIADASGLPTATPYRLRVGDEPMLVTARADGPGNRAMLTVTRPARSGGDHAPGELVRHEPGAVLLCDGSFACGAEFLAAPPAELDAELRIRAGGGLLPPDGRRYEVLVGEEVMTVTGRTGDGEAPTLSVRRSGPADHGARDVLVRYAPRTVEVFVPAEAPGAGAPAMISMAVTRRPA